jgi:hypothetical protein
MTARLEEVLAPTERALLTRLLSAASIPLDAPWVDVDWIRIPFEVLAVDRLALTLQRERGLAATRAIEEACWQLGICVDTHRSRVRRARRNSKC